MSGLTLDFDRFMSEKRAEYVTVTVYGRPYRVKREIPALLPILLARAGEEAPAKMGEALLRAGDVLFGPENMDGFARKGMSARQAAELVERTLGMICGQEMGDSGTIPDDGEANTPGK